MVRINILEPWRLTDQHLVAEHNEILILFGHVRKYPAIKSMPPRYRLGKGHISFFKNKLGYLQARHEDIKRELLKRGLISNITINLDEFPEALKKFWRPNQDDIDIIIERITTKINQKPEFYRYYHKPQKPAFLIYLLNSGKLWKTKF